MTLSPELDDDRARGLGNIWVKNTSERDDIVIDRFELLDANNVRIEGTWINPSDADHSN